MRPGMRSFTLSYTSSKAEASIDPVIEEQKAYYAARAAEYEDWFFRRGRFDGGPERNAQWFAELESVRQRVQALAPVQDALEIACGTGLWTRVLTRIAQSVTAVDASSEMIAACKNAVGSASVQFIQADLFEWEPDRQYDLVFAGFFLSHVPPERLDGFLTKLSRAVAPGGRFFAVDSRRYSWGSASATIGRRGILEKRALQDGSEFTVVKVFYEPAELEAAFARHGIEARVSLTPNFFWFAEGALQNGAQ